MGQRDGAPDTDMFSREAVRADFERLYAGLQSAHYDLYVYTSREVYEREYKAVLDAIDRPMTRLQVVRLFTPFVALGKVGHARIGFPGADFQKYVRDGGTLLPFDIRIEGDRAFILHNYSGDESLRPGVELVSLNGRACADWLKRIARYVSAERPYLAHAQMELMFPALFWLDQGKVDTFAVTVRGSQGGDKTVSITAPPATKIEPLRAKHLGRFGARKAEVLPEGVAYLRPGPFYDPKGGGIGYDGTEFAAFIDSAFRRFLQAKAGDLVLDLRDNHGGDNSFSDPMIAWFASRPFAFASHYTLKASPETRAALASLAAKYPDLPAVRQLQAALRDAADGKRVPFKVPEAQPREGPGFRGRVWALVNRHTYSNATSVAAIIQDYKFGRILGEETSDTPTSYGSAAQFTLPRTGVVVTYPKGRLVRPNGDEALLGVVPDIAIKTPLEAVDGDVVLSEAVRIVKEWRTR
jgi:hypothetical protein